MRGKFRGVVGLFLCTLSLYHSVWAFFALPGDHGRAVPEPIDAVLSIL